MILRTIASRGFRNLAGDRIALHPALNLVVGDNGQGKTNLLEAIYFLATTKSFRTPRIANLFGFSAETLFVEGVVERDALQRALSVGISRTSRKRELLQNRQPVTLHAHVSALQVFAYSSVRLRIITGSPEERRRFLDRGIATEQPLHLGELSRFQKLLTQRNALLQRIATGHESTRHLEAWDGEFIEAARRVTQQRAAYARRLTDAYRRVVARHEYHVSDLELGYEPSFPELLTDDREVQKKALAGIRSREVAAGFTLRGPHRDDLHFSTNGKDAADVLSSGEIKATVLFLKMAKTDLFIERTGQNPLFLLDDLDAELDLGILRRLMAGLTGRTQLFVTSAKPHIFRDLVASDHAVFTIRDGRIHPSSGETAGNGV